MSDVGSPDSATRSLTSFVGRATEITRILELLAPARVVTLTGPGGVGKTRLALEVVRRQAAADEAVFVDLARVDGDVGGAVLNALGAPQGAEESGLEAAVRALESSRALIVLDNCEHVLAEACQVVEAMVLRCPGITVLATSREQLGSGAEQLFVVPALSLEQAPGTGASDAVRLFVERARRVVADFAPTEFALVAKVCRRVDALPLGIELAAARVAVLSLGEIVANLREDNALLSGGPRTAPTRQVSVEASLSWSYQLLDDSEAQALQALSVFRGSFRLAAAQAILSGLMSDPARHLPVLASLVAKSLVVMEAGRDGARYRLLETVRVFANRRLWADEAVARAASKGHLEFFVADAERIEPVFAGDQLLRWLAELQADLPDLRAAIAWARQVGEADLALRLVGALWRFWWAGGRGDGRELVRIALSLPGGSAPARTKALVAGVLAASARFDFLGAVALGEEAVLASVDILDSALQARAQCWLGWMLGTFDPVSARPYLDQAIAAARAVGDITVLADALNGRAAADVRSGDLVGGQAGLAEVLDLTAATGNQITRCHAKALEAFICIAQGRLEAGLAAVTEALPTAHLVGDAVYLVLLYNSQAWLHALRRDDDAAAAAGQAAFEMGSSTGEALIASAAQAGRGIAAYAAGDFAVARSALTSAFPGLSLVTAPMAVEVAGLLARVYVVEGDPEQAGQWVDEALGLAAELGSGWARSRALLARAHVARGIGDDDLATTAAHGVLELAIDSDDELTSLAALDILSQLGVGRSTARSIQMAAAVDAAWERLGYARSVSEAQAWSSFRASARTQFGTDIATEFDTAWTEGRGFTLAEAIARERTRRGPRNRPTSGWAALTPAESRVVELVVEGLTNPAIASRLFVSRDTVKGHVSSALAKTGAANRADLAAQAARRLDPAE